MHRLLVVRYASPSGTYPALSRGDQLTELDTAGLINNVLYVIILTAALDLVGPDIPKAVVLLATTIPAVIAKTLTPTFLHLVPYYLRILAAAALSIIGMLLVALTPDYLELEEKSAMTQTSVVVLKLLGVALSSVSSSIGEVTFLGLTHFYGPFSLAGWGSGTGAAGLVGAGAYSVATTGWGFSSQAALFASAFFPLVMLIAFFGILPRGLLDKKNKSERAGPHARQRQSAMEDSDQNQLGERARDSAEQNPARTDRDDDINGEEQGLLTQSFPAKPNNNSSFIQSWISHLTTTAQQMRPLFFP